MGLGKAEYQDLFNAKGTAEKNYKIRERITGFLWREMPLTLVLALAFALPAVTGERQCPNRAKARLAGLGGYGR